MGESQDKSNSRAGSNDPGDTSPLSKTVATADAVQAELAKGGTNIDTIVGRLVIDSGLATPEEVQHCLTQAKQSVDDNNQHSLAELLVNNEYVTRRQMTRLREMAQAERSSLKIPGYRFLGKLGSGAMATVHKARQISLDRTVAIKILPPKFTSNPQFIERFYAEGRAAAQLNHPNIVQAYDVGKSGDTHYFVMEFVEGTTVYDDIVKRKRIPEDDAIDITIQIAEALLHAHERGLIHRDVKPKNIMIMRPAGSASSTAGFSAGGIVKLADMGLARAISDTEAAEAEAGKAFGTPYYISPEQIRGELKITPAADIYSLGATLYHMVTGQVPFDGKNPSSVMHKHLKAELVPPDHVYQKLSAGLSEVIEMMMAKDPKARYRNCRDLLADLRAVRAKQPPPMAHKDFAGEALTQLAKAESQAQGEIVQSSPTGATSGLGGFFAMRPWLLFLLIGVAGISLLFNIIQLFGGKAE